MQEEARVLLQSFIPEELGVDAVTAGLVKALQVDDHSVRLELVMGYPFEGVRQRYESQLQEVLSPLLSERNLELSMTCQIKPHRVQPGMTALDQVSNIIAVASGKGGVGKSTTAVNLALALQAEGARVGILDADIFGPSLPIMLGVAEGTRPKVLDGQWFVPVEALGLQSMSMGYLVDEQVPVVMRGPKASGALQQLASQTRWQSLDYLIVDLPPGTGDIQLTLAQRIPVAGAVVVTTPQDIALLDARKGIEMFRKVNIGVLGIAENMAMHRCSQCGHIEHIFGQGGGERIAEQYDTSLLGSLPLSMAIREQADGGRPTVLADAEGDVAMAYRQLARRTAARLSLQPEAERGFPPVQMSNE